MSRRPLMSTARVFSRLLVVAACASALVVPAAASAAERPFSSRFSTNVNGQIITAANTIVQCPTTTVDPLLNSGCAGARAGTSARNNNTFDMGWLDVDSDPGTFDSSSAQLLLPTSGRVLFAGLYWLGMQKKGDVVIGANGYRGVPQNAPDAAAIGTVKLQVPGVIGYTTITAAQVDEAAVVNGSGYGAMADVTTLVSAAGAGTYTVADIQTATGGNGFGGWTLVVAYSDPAEPLRNLTVFDGLQVVNATAFADIPLMGFRTPTTGSVRTTMGVVAAEGDAGATGDYLTLNDQRLSDAVHPLTNTQNSTIANRGVLVTTKTPNWGNQLGYDSSLFSADGFLPNGATTAMFRAKTNLDSYAPQAVTFATELFSPNVVLTKTAVASSNGQPGTTITYTITATNNGTGDATNVQLRDPIPAGVTYAAGPFLASGSGNVAAGWDATTTTVTANLGAGASSTAGGTLGPGQSASITFSASINVADALGQLIENTTTLGFVSADLSLPISTVASAATTVAYPDVAINKTMTLQSGTTYRFNISVTNVGSLPTLGTVDVADALPTGASISVAPAGTGWTCPPGSPGPNVICQRNDALAPGATYPPILVTYTFPPATPVTNTATVTGGSEPAGTGSPALDNNTSTAAVGNSPSAVLSLSKSALTGTISLGSLAGFKLAVRNVGPSTATNVTLTDTLPSGLFYDSYVASAGTCTVTGSGATTTTVTCNVGTLDSGYGATVTIRARPGPSLLGTTVTNSATATSDITTLPVTKTASLTIRPGADLVMAKTASVATVDQGGAVSYTLTATNNGAAAATNLQIVDRLPAAFDAATAVMTPSGSGTCTRTGTTVSCQWTGATAAAATRTVTISGTMLVTVPVADRASVNRANVFSNTDDPDPSNNAATAVVTVIPAADLEARATSPGMIPAGSSGDMTFTALNNGPSAATGTVLTITLPAGLAPTKVPADCSTVGQIVTCAIGTLTNGATAERVITISAASDLVEATRAATVTVSSDVPDPLTANNTDTAPLVAGPVADLTITKVADVENVAPGGTVSYSIGVANAGGSSSIGAIVVDSLPTGLRAVSATSSSAGGCTISGQKVTCAADEIVPHESLQILIIATVGKDRAGSTFVNVATVSPGAQKDPNLANNTASATVRVTTPKGSIAKLKIKVSAKPATSRVGTRVVLTARVTNTSKRAANTVKVCITIPQALRYVTSKGTKQGARVCFTRDQLLAQQTVTFSVTTLSLKPGPVRPRGSTWAGNAAYAAAVGTLTIVRPKGGPAPPVTG